MKDANSISYSAVVPGTLIRTGIETRCLVAFPLDASASNPPAFYSRCAVLRTEERLSDGFYELEFLDQNAFVCLQAGVWSTGRPWHSRREPSRELSSPAAWRVPA